jgi:hypothetical protein
MSSGQPGQIRRARDRAGGWLAAGDLAAGRQGWVPLRTIGPY